MQVLFTSPENRLPEQTVAFLTNNATTKIFKKKTILVEEGNTFPYLGIIKKGGVRCYTVNEGKETVVSLLFEGDYLCDFRSFFSQIPTDFYFETLEETEIDLVSYDFLNDCRSKDVQELRVLDQHLLLYQSKLFEDRLFILLLDNAKARYQKFMELHSEIMLRVPHYIIASYLAVTPETLSRIRKKVFLERKKTRVA